MADTWFISKEWKARLVEFAGRRLLRNVANGETATYDVSRSEGQVSQEGDAFNTKNMNDFEQRVANGFANAKTAVDTLSRELVVQEIGDYSSQPLEKAIVSALNNKFEGVRGKHLSFQINTASGWYAISCQKFDGVNGIAQRWDSSNDTYAFYVPHGGADAVLKKLGSFQRKLLGRVTSSTTFDCKSIPGWEDFTENNFAIIPVKIDATGGQWKNGATGAGGAQQGGCTPTLSYDKVNGILKVSNFSWNNDYAYGSYWTNYCHGNMTADVYCYHF